MLESIVEFFADILDCTSDWWLGKIADWAEKKHPSWFGNGRRD